jgi:TM2 domain-containing membrane protein YozV
MKPNACCFLLWISLLLTATPALRSQDAAQCVAFAREQMARGNDSLARKTLQRVLFFDRKTYGVTCYAELATLNLRLNDYAQSEFYFDLLYHATRSDSLREVALFGKTGALLLQSKYREARVELLSLPAQLSPDAAVRRHLLMGAALYGERRFDEAEKELLALLPEEDLANRTELQQLLQRARHYDRKNPRTARILSIVLPGSGQFYAGDFRNGFNSLILNGLTASWFIYTATTVSFGDALMSVGSWVFRYYAGGYQRAGRLVEERKQERLQRNFQRIVRLYE